MKDFVAIKKSSISSVLSPWSKFLSLLFPRHSPLFLFDYISLFPLSVGAFPLTTAVRVWGTKIHLERPREETGEI